MSSAIANTAELPVMDVDVSFRERIRFSYARPEDPWLRKMVIHAIEKMSGQRFIRRTYLDWSSHAPRRENIFAAGIRLLGIALDYDAAALACVPAKGPLLVVANHPFGVADGLALGDLLTRVRPDTKIMTHSLLCQPQEASQFLLPVDFGSTKEARQRSARTRQEALSWLKDGHCVAIFPAGGVATRQSPLRGPALDLTWHPFVARLASVNGVRVLPLHFKGQNSTLFHLASHVSYPLRVALLFRETMRHLGGRITVKIGAAVAGERLCHAEGREAVAAQLRELTFALDSTGTAASAPFRWPRHIRW